MIIYGPKEFLHLDSDSGSDASEQLPAADQSSGPRFARSLRLAAELGRWAAGQLLIRFMRCGSLVMVH